VNVKLKYRLAKYVRIIAKHVRKMGAVLNDESFWACVGAWAIFSILAIAFLIGVFLAGKNIIITLVEIFGGYMVLGTFCLILMAIFSIVLIVGLIKDLFNWAEDTQIPTAVDLNKMLGETNVTTKEKILNGQK